MKQYKIEFPKIVSLYVNYTYNAFTAMRSYVNIFQIFDNNQL